MPRDDDRHDVQEFRQFLLLSDESIEFHQALADVHVAVNLGIASGQLPNPADFTESAPVIADIMHRFLGAAEEEWAGPAGWVGGLTDISIDVLAYRGRAADLACQCFFDEKIRRTI
jgi:hypothetical protein